MRGGASAAAAPGPDLESTSLIVKFERLAASPILPEDAVDVVTDAVSTQGAALSGADWALFARIGSPVGANWLIQHRFPAVYLDALRAEDPDHPELHLQEYVVLRYADVGTRLAAEGKLGSDKAVRSFRPNSRMGFSARINDYYVATTGPTQIPQGYQWGLEAIGAMTPWNNLTVQSAWDKATGFGYVTVIDSGIQKTHPDLQENFRAHFSQAFHTPTCSGNSQVEVDETGGVGSTCPNTWIGHGTHVVGVIGATANNTIGVGGVCWNCSLIIAKTYDNNDRDAAMVMNGLNHAILRGTQVANLSGGFEHYLAKWNGIYGSNIWLCSQVPVGADGFCDAIALAVRRDLAFVAATGNKDDSNRIDFPASEPSVVAVAATNSANEVWFRGRGNPPGNTETGSSLGKLTPTLSYIGTDFVAPGARIMSTFYDGATYSPGWVCNDWTYTGGYDECTGTSMAAPHVSGSMALVRSVNPLSTVATVKSLLLATATNVPRPPEVTPAGYFKMPSLLAAVNQAISNGYTWPAFSMVTSTGQWNRFTTAAPQMARAAIAGTMLPTLIAPFAPVYYVPDPNAPTVTGYTAFPDSTVQPRAYFKVYTRIKVSQTALKPLYRLSKLQNLGNGRDECGNLMPVPTKPIPVIHTYTTNKNTRNQLMGTGAGQCYKYHGVEGYVAPSNLGSLQELIQLYNPTSDSYILVPSSKVSMANGLGYTQQQISLGWVVPN